jgi:putative oxygen-independent coproporphyrinogen III oxidase
MTPSGSDPAPPGPEATLGVYVHVPFCSVRCTYCDFATVTGRDDRIGPYLEALTTEIARHQEDASGEVDSIFFGGGTPSRLRPQEVASILAALHARFEVSADAEVTLEGNPESLTAEAMRGLADAGITRLSIGVQSFDDAVLARVGRAHDAAEAVRAVAEARGTGFRDISVDLIAGLPGEDLGAWEDTVRRAAGLGPDHVSVYLLESDKETPLGRAVRSGRQAVAGDDALADAYAATVSGLAASGFSLYEISNFARGGRRSRHNLKYWQDDPFVGFGLSAAGYVAGERRTNRRDLDGYVADVRAGRSPVAWRDPYDRDRRLEEALFLGLRVREGVDLAALGSRYGADPARRFAAAWERGEAAGLVAREGTRMILTDAGRVRSNELFAELIGVRG